MINTELDHQLRTSVRSPRSAPIFNHSDDVATFAKSSGRDLADPPVGILANGRSADSLHGPAFRREGYDFFCPSNAVR
jgi:hypothetical protein